MQLKTFVLILAAVIIGSVVGVCLVIAATVFALTAPARAHDGYEPICCNEIHCKPVPDGAMKRKGAFWVLPDGTQVRAGNTRRSSAIGKRGFHVCKWNEGDIRPLNYEETVLVRPKGAPACLYVPDEEF